MTCVHAALNGFAFTLLVTPRCSYLTQDDIKKSAFPFRHLLQGAGWLVRKSQGHVDTRYAASEAGASSFCLTRMCTAYAALLAVKCPRRSRMKWLQGVPMLCALPPFLATAPLMAVTRDCTNPIFAMVYLSLVPRVMYLRVVALA